MLIEKMFQAERAPRVVATLLALGIAGEIASASSQLLVAGASGQTMPQISTEKAVVQRKAVNVGAIVSAHLFGTAQTRAADVRESRAGLVLAGTIAMSIPGRGFAFIGESASATKLYVVGSQIPGGGTLLRVLADHVVLNRDNVVEKLSLAHPGLRLSAPNAVATAEAADTTSMTAQAVAATGEEFPPGNKPWE